MNLKAVFKYQLMDYRNVILIYYLVLILLHIVGVVSLSLNPQETYTIGGMEFSAMITMFIVGICSFGDNFHMLIQNNISRKTIFVCRIATITATSLIIGVCNQAYALLSGLIVNESKIPLISSMYMLYSGYFQGKSELYSMVINLLFTVVGIMAFMIIGYFIAVWFYRSGKIGRIGIAAGLPVFCSVILPIIGDTWGHTALFRGLGRFIGTVFGAYSGNPLYAVAAFFVLFVLFGGITYLLMRRLPVEK